LAAGVGGMDVMRGVGGGDCWREGGREGVVVCGLGFSEGFGSSSCAKDSRYVCLWQRSTWRHWYCPLNR